MLANLAAQLPQFFSWENGYYVLLATVRTIMLAVLGCGIGFALAFVLVYLRTIPGWFFLPVRWLMVTYVEFFRRVPFLVLLFLVLFMAKSSGFDISLFTVACITVAIISIAFSSEIVRAGLESVAETQWDAATVMNFGRMQTLIHIVLPQAWKVIIPPAFAFFVNFIKETSIASQIGLVELTQLGKYFNATIGYAAILSFGSILVLYFVICYPLTRFGWWMETRMTRARTIESDIDRRRIVELGRISGGVRGD